MKKNVLPQFRLLVGPKMFEILQGSYLPRSSLYSIHLILIKLAAQLISAINFKKTLLI